jgi:hypothetical protein
LIVDFISTSEGAQAPSSKLIVGCGYSKISFHYCEDCRIFCDGVKDSTIGISSNNGLVGLIGLGLVGLIGFGLISLVGLSGINGLIRQIGLVGLVGLSGFSLISLVGLSLDGLIGHTSLTGLIGDIGFGLISLVGLSGFSLVGLSGIHGLIVQIGLTGFVGLSGFGLISLVGIIGFELVGLSGINDLVGLDSLVAAIIAAAEFLVAMATQAAAAKIHGIAIKLASTTKITNAAIWYYCAALLLVLLSLIWRESGLWCEWGVFSSLAGLDSVFENALQNAKQLFHIILPQMTKYCVMRECENILCGYLYDGDLVFAILKRIYGFKFPKRFLEISSRDLTSSLLLFLFS